MRWKACKGSREERAKVAGSDITVSAVPDQTENSHQDGADEPA